MKKINNKSLREVANIAQPDPDLTKRWFNSQAADLFIWHDGAEYIRFEFCYNKHINEHSLRWQEDVGFSHSRIDDGENTSRHKESPVLIETKEIDSDYIYEIFETLSVNIEPIVRAFILDLLVGDIHD